MDNDQIIARLAREVMKWQKRWVSYGHADIVCDAWCWLTQDQIDSGQKHFEDTEVTLYHGWNPLLNWSDAGMILDKAYSWVCGTNFDPDHKDPARLIPDGKFAKIVMGTGLSAYQGYAVAPKAPQAISRAALKILEGRENES